MEMPQTFCNPRQTYNYTCNLLQKRSVNQCQSLEEVASHFQRKLLHINQMVTLRNARHDDSETQQQMLHSLATQLSELEMLLVVMRAELTRRRQALADVQVRNVGNIGFLTILVRTGVLC